MHRLILLLVVTAVVAALEADARACDPVSHSAHVVAPSSDQTPPTLPAIPPPGIRHGDGTQGTCTPSDCADLGSISISAVATDDTTTPDKIGYRFSLAAGTLPARLFLPDTAIDPAGTFIYLHFDADAAGAIDFTLQVVAIDAAGNESAPQMVRVSDGSGGCAIARGHGGRPALVSIALFALLVAAYRRRRA